MSNYDLDTLETMIIMALDANHEVDITGDCAYKQKNHVTQSNEKLYLVDQGSILKVDDMHPSSAFTFDVSQDQDDRLFTTHHEYLVSHPSDIFGDGKEIMVMNDRYMKWVGIRKIRRLPKGVSVLGKPDSIYEMHFRIISKFGHGKYIKRLLPIDKSGKALCAKIQNSFVGSPNFEGTELNLAASMIEDACRSNSMLATIKESVELKFPVPLSDYKKVFADREAPMLEGANRRRSIIHWVAKHLRKSTKGNVNPVIKHVRGVRDIVIDGLTINIEPNHERGISGLIESLKATA